MAYIDTITLEKLVKIDENCCSYDIVYEADIDRARRYLPMWEQFLYGFKKRPKLKIKLDNKEMFFIFPGIPRRYCDKKLVEPKYISDDFQLIDLPILKPEVFIIFSKDPLELEYKNIRLRSGIEGSKMGIPTWSGWEAYSFERKFHKFEDFAPSLQFPWTLHNNAEYYLLLELEVKDNNIEVFFTNDGWNYFRTIMYVFSREE